MQLLVGYYPKTRSSISAWHDSLPFAVRDARATFESRDLYPDVLAKAAALCYLIVLNHPFVDGNKRVEHAAMETMLILNGFEISADIEQQERIILDLAAGNLSRERFTDWLKRNVVDYRGTPRE